MGGSRTLCLICVLLVGSAFVSASAQSRRPKNVQVSLRAKWPGTPLLLEAGELLSKQSNNLFWEFTELWLQPDRGSDCLTARCCVKKMVDDGRMLLSEQSGSIFEFSLTLRSTSPRLVLFRQLAEESLTSYPLDDDDGDQPNFMGEESESSTDRSVMSGNPRSPGGSCCWVDVGSTLLFSVPEVASWLDTESKLSIDVSEQPEIFEFDHLHPDSNVASTVVILYGALGTECFHEFHNVLAEASKEGKVKYVVRPVLPSGCQAVTSYCSAIGTSDAVNLGGYGVELALKNMEYKAMDDSAIKKGVTLEDPRTDDLSQEIRGFIFSKILERKPELTDEVMAFRDYLLSSTISDTLEVWELKDLGHQTAQRIVHASDPLQAMQEINQNFPTVVSSLSRMKLDNSIKNEIIANQRMVPPGKSLMALNGALINIEDVDLYLLMDLVHEELLLADQFSKLQVVRNDVRIGYIGYELKSSKPRTDKPRRSSNHIKDAHVDIFMKQARSRIDRMRRQQRRSRVASKNQSE